MSSTRCTKPGSPAGTRTSVPSPRARAALRWFCTVSRLSPACSHSITTNSNPARPASSTETGSPRAMKVPRALGFRSISSRSRLRKTSATLRCLQKLFRALGDRPVDELARSSFRGGAARLLESPEHLLGPCKLFRRGREDLVDDRHLARVDGGLAEESQPFRRLGLSSEACVILQLRMDAIARPGLAGGARGDDQMGARVERLLLARRAAEVGRQVETSVRKQRTRRRGGDLESRENTAR